MMNRRTMIGLHHPVRTTRTPQELTKSMMIRQISSLSSRSGNQYFRSLPLHRSLPPTSHHHRHPYHYHHRGRFSSWTGQITPVSRQQQQTTSGSSTTRSYNWWNPSSVPSLRRRLQLSTTSRRTKPASMSTSQPSPSSHTATTAPKHPSLSSSSPEPTNVIRVQDLYLGTHLSRLALAFGFVYVTTEYVADITICEGPSMIPTIQPSGEIILFDRLTPRLWGLRGGTIGRDRAFVAQEKQRVWNQQLQQHNLPSYKHIWYEPKIPVNRIPSSSSTQPTRTNELIGGYPTTVWQHLWEPISVGDVVVVQHPDRVGTVCKRVLGLPGDVVTKPQTARGAQRLHNHPNVTVLRRRKSAVCLTVPDGHIWVEGDNPWNSSDSRNYGPIPASLIVGRVVCRVWPLKFQPVNVWWNRDASSQNDSRGSGGSSNSAWMKCGDRPIHDDDDDGNDNGNGSGNGNRYQQRQRPSLAFSGSIVFPAGFHNQIIVRDYDTWVNTTSSSSSSKSKTQ